MNEGGKKFKLKREKIVKDKNGPYILNSLIENG